MTGTLALFIFQINFSLPFSFSGGKDHTNWCLWWVRFLIQNPESFFIAEWRKTTLKRCCRFYFLDKLPTQSYLGLNTELHMIFQPLGWILRSFYKFLHLEKIVLKSFPTIIISPLSHFSEELCNSFLYPIKATLYRSHPICSYQLGPYFISLK